MKNILGKIHDKYLDILDKLRLQYRLNKLHDKYLAFKRFFKNIYRWYPILISDEQWDSGYIYDVLNHKLKLMEKFFRGDNTHSVDVLKYADEIKEVREILERLIEDDYMTEEATEYYSNFKIENLNNKMERAEREDVMRWHEEEYLAREADKMLLFDSLDEKMEGWWD